MIVQDSVFLIEMNIFSIKRKYVLNCKAKCHISTPWNRGRIIKGTSFRIALVEVASMRFNIGSDRKKRKRQNSTSKQM